VGSRRTAVDLTLAGVAATGSQTKTSSLTDSQLGSGTSLMPSKPALRCFAFLYQEGPLRFEPVYTTQAQINVRSNVTQREMSVKGEDSGLRRIDGSAQWYDRVLEARGPDRQGGARARVYAVFGSFLGSYLWGRRGDLPPRPTGGTRQSPLDSVATVDTVRFRHPEMFCATTCQYIWRERYSLLAHPNCGFARHDGVRYVVLPSPAAHAGARPNCREAAGSACRR
jgi:hypothetical protein